MTMCEGSVTHGPEYWSSATAVLDLLFALWAYAASGQRHWNPLVRILYPLLALNAIGSIGYHSTNSNFFGKIDLWSQMIITMIGAPVALDEVVRTLILPNSGFEPVPLLPIQNAVVPDSNSEIVTVSQPTIVPESSFYGISKSVWIEGGYRAVSLLIYVTVVTLSLAAIVSNALDGTFLAHIGTGVGMVLAILSLLVMGFVTHRPLLSRLAEQRQVRGYIVTVAVVLPNLLGLWMLYEDCLCRANPHLWSRVPFHALWHLLGTWTTYVLFQMLALFTAPRIGAAPFIAVPDDATPSLWKCFLYWIACFVVYRRL